MHAESMPICIGTFLQKNRTLRIELRLSWGFRLGQVAAFLCWQ